MSAETPPAPTDAVRPPTLEELRAKLAQAEIDAQRSELRRRLADATSERHAEAA